MVGCLPVASAAASREPAVVRARKDASWARVKGSEEEEEGAGAEEEGEVELLEVDGQDEGEQEVDERRDDAVAEDDDDDIQASPLPYTPPPPRPRESGEKRRCEALLRDAKRCCVGAGTGEEGLGENEAASEEEAPGALADTADTGRDGDGEAPRRGSGELAAFAASLVSSGDRTDALPRDGRSGVTRAAAAPTGA